VAASIAPVLGVTGSIAAGKSALSKRLAALGAHVVDVDGLGHRALGSPDVKRAVVATFGRGMLLGESGTLDHRALAAVVFGDSAARVKLEAIVHPLVKRWIDEEIAAARAGGAPLVVVDCALLFESGLDALCDATVAVDAPEAVRAARALAAHGWDAAELARRAAAQFPAAEKRARAGRVFVNDGSDARLADEARLVFEEVLRGPRAAAARRKSS
jgi:dephospho-CoA kinase